jgi:hypothetical protein
MGRQPVLDRHNHALLIPVVALWQLKHLGNMQQADDNLLIRLSPNPEDGAVFQSVAVGIFQRDLRLADAA